MRDDAQEHSLLEQCLAHRRVLSSTTTLFYLFGPACIFYLVSKLLMMTVFEHVVGCFKSHCTAYMIEGIEPGMLCLRHGFRTAEGFTRLPCKEM
jgi:hypothetical protein